MDKRITGIEPVTPTWKDGMLPLHQIRKNAGEPTCNFGEMSTHGYVVVGKRILLYLHWAGYTGSVIRSLRLSDALVSASVFPQRAPPLSYYTLRRASTSVIQSYPMGIRRFPTTQVGLEPTTNCLEGSCSIQLSYWVNASSYRRYSWTSKGSTAVNYSFM